MPENKNQYPNLIRRLRKNRKLSQRKIIRLLGYSDKSMFSRYERGHALPPLSLALKLSVLLQTPIEGLYPEHYRGLKQEVELRKAQHLKLSNSSKRPMNQAPTSILNSVNEKPKQFLPNKVEQYQALQIARKLEDTANLRDYLVLSEHYSFQVLLKACRGSLNAANKAEAFRKQFQQITNSHHEQ